jgi:hypothetical protein
MSTKRFCAIAVAVAGAVAGAGAGAAAAGAAGSTAIVVSEAAVSPQVIDCNKNAIGLMRRAL